MIHIFFNGLFRKTISIFLLILTLVACNEPEDDSTSAIDNSLMPINHAPTIVGESFSIDEGSNLQGVTIAVDEDGDNLNYNLISDVTNGVLSFKDDGSFTYQAATGFYGEDSFTVSASDGSLLSNTATFIIHVIQTNNTPTISGESFSVDNDSSLQGKAKGSDQDGDILSYNLMSDVSNGVLLFSNDGSFTYQPSEGFHGEDSFTVSVSDGKVSSNTAKFTIQVTVASIISGTSKVTRLNRPITFPINSNNNGYQELVFSFVEQPEKGIAIFNDDNTITYTPIQGSVGVDEFKVQASDGESIVTAIVTIDNNLSYKGKVITDTIEGVEVLLTGDGYLRTVIPDVSGEFKFYGLPDGSYAVKVSKSGFKSSIAKDFKLDIVEVNHSKSNENEDKKIDGAKAPLTGANEFVLTAIDNHNFNFHWEEDLSTAGYEYSSKVDETLTVEFLDELLTVTDNAAANKLFHDFNIALTDSGDMKWTQEHAYRIAEIMKFIPQEKRNPYKPQLIKASKWELTSNYIENDIEITQSEGHKTVTITDAIFANSTANIEGRRQGYYSQRLHLALNKFIKGADAVEVEPVLIPDYVFPGKIKRVDISVVGLPEEDKTVTIEIENHALGLEVEGAKSAYLRVVSEIGTFTDVHLKPVDINGDEIAEGGVSKVLKGSFILSKHAKSGFWYPEKVIITDATDSQIEDESKDFNWKLYVNNPLAAGLIFSENFDAQPDWTTTGRNMLGELPTNWDAGRTDENWHPADGDTGAQPSMQINGNNLNQVYGDSGKAFITHSESYNDLSNNGFTSDGFITKDIPSSREVYLRFKVKFQPGWSSNVEGGQIKMVRIVHWDGADSGTGERNKFFNSGNNAPVYIYDWSQNDYGVRHFHAFRCDNQEANYYCTSPGILDAPRQITSGDMSANYSTDVEIENPSIPDLVNGGVLDYTSTNYHDQVWGDTWHTVGIHVKLNSSAGVQDGIFQYWLDGEKMVSMLKVPWIGEGGDINATWNSLSFGGNDKYHFKEDGLLSERERWYAIDDIEVYNILPEGL